MTSCADGSALICAVRARSHPRSLSQCDLEEPDGDDRIDLEGLVVGGRRGGRDGQTKFWPFGTATGHDRRLDYSVAKSRVSIVFRENGGPRGRQSCAKDPAVDPAWTPQVSQGWEWNCAKPVVVQCLGFTSMAPGA